MKKKLTIALAVLAMCFALAACGGTDMSDSPYLGKWTATTADYSGIEMSVESILGGEFSFTLNDNGKCDVTVAGESDSGKWTETEDGFNVLDEFDFTVDGDLAVLDYSGITLYFERQ